MNINVLGAVSPHSKNFRNWLIREAASCSGLLSGNPPLGHLRFSSKSFTLSQFSAGGDVTLVRFATLDASKKRCLARTETIVGTVPLICQGPKAQDHSLFAADVCLSGARSISQTSPLKSPSTRMIWSDVAIGAVPGRYAGISISVDAYSAMGSPSTSPDSEEKCL